MFENLLIGGMAGVISRTVTAPLELYKIQRQNQYLKDAKISQVLRKEGIRYLWKGNMTNCLRAFPQFSCNYAIFKSSKEHIFSDIQHEKLRDFLSGGVAGVVAMGAIYPLETIRTRLSLQMNKSHYANPYQVLRKLRLSELYRGLGISILGFGPFSAFNFMFYYNYAKMLENTGLNSTSTKLLAGGMAGMCALSITYPTDLLRRHFQMAGFSNEVPKYKGIFDGFRTVVIADGIRGLYKGLLAAYIRVIPCLAIQFWCLEKGKQLLGGN